VDFEWSPLPEPNISFRLHPYPTRNFHCFLQKSDCQIKDANGKNLKTYGTAQMKILFCDKILEHNVLVCDILPEGILA
jgi:hypothetical protein